MVVKTRHALAAKSKALRVTIRIRKTAAAPSVRAQPIPKKFPDGIYEGLLKQDKRHGKGRMTFLDGSIYDGSWKDDKEHGTGILLWANGDKYEGLWKDGYYCRGSLIQADGNAYQGGWKPPPDGAADAARKKKGVRNGPGKCQLKTGESFDGIWLVDKFERGTYVYANGNVYQGDFLFQKRHGQGKLTDPDGNVIHEGTWQHDVFVNNNDKEPNLFAALSDYRDHPDIQHALKGASLLTFAEFSVWFTQSVRENQRSQFQLQDSHLSKDMLYNIAEHVCEKHIGGSYGRNAIQNVVKTNGFDAVFILAKEYEKLKRDEFATRPEIALKKKLDHVLGFLITERGECERLPTVHSVHLICTREVLTYKLFGKNEQREKARGAVLMGAYLHCLKQKGDETGILELAGGYTNCGGFFSYSKMGFVKNLDLFQNPCFTEPDNLPMSCDLTQLTADDIVGYASGVKKWTKVSDDFLRVVPRTEDEKQKQLEIARYCNVLYKLAYLQQFEPPPDLFTKKENKLLEGHSLDALDELIEIMTATKKKLIDDFVGKENVATV